MMKSHRKMHVTGEPRTSSRSGSHRPFPPQVSCELTENSAMARCGSLRRFARGERRGRTIQAISTKGEPTLKKEQEMQRDDLSVPEYAASRGDRLEGILGRVSDAP